MRSEDDDKLNVLKVIVSSGRRRSILRFLKIYQAAIDGKWVDDFVD
jgi:hypothetical protein